MSVTCSGCTVSVLEKIQVKVPIKNGVEVSTSQLLLDAEEVGLHPAELNNALQNCNKLQALPAYTFTPVDKEVVVEREKNFDGTREQALASGWQENEFGLVCSVCAGEDDDPNTEHGSVVSDNNPLIKIAVNMSILKRQPDGIGKILTPEVLCGDGTVDVNVVLDNLEALPYAEQIFTAENVCNILEECAQDTSSPEAATSLGESVRIIKKWMQG